jgi:hypothetical protein
MKGTLTKQNGQTAKRPNGQIWKTVWGREWLFIHYIYSRVHYYNEFPCFYIKNTNLAVWPFGRLAVLIKFLFYSFVSKKNFCTFANETETLRKCQLTKRSSCNWKVLWYSELEFRTTALAASLMPHARIRTYVVHSV